MLFRFVSMRSIIEQLGGKQMVMQLLAHEDPNVRYEALLAVQKLMVHNWYVPDVLVLSPATGRNRILPFIQGISRQATRKGEEPRI